MIGLEVGVVHESHDYDDHSLTQPHELGSIDLVCRSGRNIEEVSVGGH